MDNSFHAQEKIDAEKAKRMTKYQREDVLFKLHEEEQNMLETTTSRIYDKSEYDRLLDKANKNILDGISHRMTKKHAVIAGIIPPILFLIGFLPLLVSELNNLGTASMSFLLTAIACTGVLVSSFVMLFVFKHMLIKRFKEFNTVMDGIYNGIIGSLNRFSEYLSHAANVMKEFAVLNACQDQDKSILKVYRKHEIDIERNMSDIMIMFSDYVNENYVPDDDIDPFDYDFDVPVTYSYDMPYRKSDTQIDFLQSGNSVNVPIDFIKSIKLIREELYD